MSSLDWLKNLVYKMRLRNGNDEGSDYPKIIENIGNSYVLAVLSTLPILGTFAANIRP
jgi:hypothetical protein